MKTKTMTGRVISRWWALFVMPTCIAFFLGFVVPMIMGIYLSFTRFTTITDATWVGIENYKKSFADPDFVHAFWYTVAFTIVTTILVNIGAFFVAYMFTKVMHGAKLFRSVFFLPNLIGGIVLGYIWQLLLNGILAHWNLSLTYSAGWGFLGMVILTCWQQIGYMMIIYIAGLQSVPSELLEAAAVDGASPRQTLFKVTLPLMMPSITVCSFLTITNGFKMFDQNLALTNGAPSNTSELLALNIYRTFYGRVGFEGVGQAKAVVFLILVAVIAIIQNRLTTSKEVQA